MQEYHGKSASQFDQTNKENPLQDPKQDVEKLLLQGNVVQFMLQGYSMYPLFVPGRDQAVVAPVDTDILKRGDVVLYRREGSILVLHRIWRRKGNQFYLVGDNQKEIEGPLQADQIKGILIEIVRKGRHFSVGNFNYRFWAGFWLCLRPFRPFLSRTAAWCKRFLNRK